MDGAQAAADAIARSGPIGWILLIFLILSLVGLTGVLIVGFRTGVGVLRALQQESAQSTKRALELIGQVKDSVADLRTENNKQFAEMHQQMAAELGNVRERLGRLEGAAGIMAPPFLSGHGGRDNR